MDVVNVGVIGVGYLGQQHARIYAELPEARLVGVVDIDEAKASRVGQRYRTGWSRDLEYLFGKVDAVSIAVPTNLHYDIARALLATGIHVLIEKPITETVSQAEALLKLAEEKGLFIQVGHIERFNPVIHAIKDIVTDPRFIEVHRLSRYGLRGTEVGVVLDLMIHDIDIILNIVKSRVVEVDALGVGVLNESEDIANARLKFENGCVANITASRVSIKKMRKIRIFQPYTYISLDYYKQKGVAYIKEGKGIKRKSIPVEKGEPLKCELASFLDCVRESKQPLISGEHAKEALDVAIKIVKQIEDSQKTWKQ